MRIKETVFLALDNLTFEEAVRTTQQVAPIVCGVKIHDLYDTYGPFIVDKLRKLGVTVWVDLKLHDIPDTVSCRAAALRDAGASIITVHASGGSKMIQKVVRLVGQDVKVYAVTLLTSLDAEDAKKIYGGTPDFVVTNLARLAVDSGASGIVCSPNEVGLLRRTLASRGIDLVVPGVRSLGVSVDDQARVGTPLSALQAGATHLVVGRQITKAPDPARALLKLDQEIADAFSYR